MTEKLADALSEKPSNASERGAIRRIALLMEHAFETLLWSCRYIVLVAVIISILVSLGMFYTVTVDAVVHLRQLPEYSANAVALLEAGSDEEAIAREDAHEGERSTAIARTVEVIDGYLLATVMLILAFGLYELFISRIAAAEADQRASRILQIHSLNDLKHRLGQVILLILVVKLFEHALRIDIDEPLKLLWLALAILLVAGALHLAHQGNKPSTGSGEPQ